MALRYANIDVETREIALREKPLHMLAVSPKGTVPVLVLSSGKVLEQSLDIMDWALAQSDVDEWIVQNQEVQKLTADLIATNDGAFKQALDKYKYAIRFPENPPDVYRAQGEAAAIFDDLDLESYLPTHITVVEWGEGLADRLSDEYLEITLAHGDDENVRTLDYVGHGERWVGIAL